MVEVFKGTTTVGVLCDGGVVLASESRATMGSFIASSQAKKIYQIDDLVGMTTAGAVGDAQSLVRMVQVEARLYKMQRGERMTVKAVTSMLANILSSRRYYPFMVQLVMGGVDRYGPKIYSQDLFARCVRRADRRAENCVYRFRFAHCLRRVGSHVQTRDQHRGWNRAGCPCNS